MDNVNEEKVQAAADNTAEAEEKTTAVPELGKFKSVDALLNAYRALEAEFTRRNQRLKELEDGNKAADVRTPPSPESANENPPSPPLIDEEVKRAVIEDYLKAVSCKGVPLMSGGIAPAAPRTTLKSVKEAGELAQKYFKKD